jgi:acyl carrier protein
VPRKEQTPMISELRSFLKSKLPEYMVPSVFVFLESLPLTPSGKIDRKSLPAPDRNRAGLEQAYVAPRSPTEEILAGIWAEVLKPDQVGIHDNFFELGGHSLSASRVVLRAREAFKMELPLRTLFEKPTIEELALVISASQVVGAELKDLYCILTELEVLSDQEAQQLLAGKTR